MNPVPRRACQWSRPAAGRRRLPEAGRSARVRLTAAHIKIELEALYEAPVAPSRCRAAVKCTRRATMTQLIYPHTESSVRTTPEHVRENQR